MDYVGDERSQRSEAELEQQLVALAWQGRIQGCMALQDEINFLKRSRGLDCSRLPEEYWSLTHRRLAGTSELTDEEAESNSRRLSQLLAEAHMDSSAAWQESLALPAEYLRLQSEADLAAEREDWAEHTRLAGAARKMIKELAPPFPCCAGEQSAQEAALSWVSGRRAMVLGFLSAALLVSSLLMLPFSGWCITGPVAVMALALIGLAIASVLKLISWVAGRYGA